MSNPLAITDQNQPSEWLQLADFSAKVCKADLLPDHLRNKPADCLLVAMQARRWGMDFFAVAQCTSIVRGKPMYEGKLVAAAINASGKLKSPLNHRFEGSAPPRLSVTIIGRLVDEEEPREWEVTWDEGFKHAQDKGQWNTSPKKRLLYFATREWARVHMPEVMLGVVADDEQLPASTQSAPRDITPLSEVPVTAEVKVREVEEVLPTPQEEPPLIQAEVETAKPEDPEAEQLRDFLIIISEYKDGHDLTMAVKQAYTFKSKAHINAAKKAISRRATDLGLSWYEETREFRPIS